MSTENQFPEELLAAPIEQRISYFEDFTIAHPNLLKAAEKLTTSLNEPVGSAIIFLFGPTGVGKTTLLMRTIQRLTEQFLAEYEKDKSCLLFAGFEAPAPELRSFSWKSVYVRALEALRNPLIDREDHLLARINGVHSTKDRLRLLLEKDLHYRRPKLFYIDEAQNFGKVSNAKHFKDQADCIKSISNLAGVPILLVGTYELLYLRNRSAQLARRSTDIHYPRYRVNTSNDEKVFKNIVHKFQRNLPLEEQPNLTANWDFCYERSLGCVGILKDWLSRTLAGTLVNNSHAKTITLSDLEKYAYSLNICSIMLREIREEEKVLEESISRNDLRLQLGLNTIEEVKPKTQVKPPQEKSFKRKRVGEPNPKRRKIGDAQDAS